MFRDKNLFRVFIITCYIVRKITIYCETIKLKFVLCRSEQNVICLNVYFHSLSEFTLLLLEPCHMGRL